MRIRTPFAFAFVVLVFASGYLGFSDIKLSHDKFLHGITFFLLSTVFYWVIEAPRKRCINFTLVACTFIGGVGSECLQGFLPYRQFDFNDIWCNIAGSLAAVGLNSWYHKRQLERRKQARYELLRSGVSDSTTSASVSQDTELDDMEAIVESAEPAVSNGTNNTVLQQVAPEPLK